MSNAKQKKAKSFTITVEDKECRLKPINRATLKIVLPMITNQNNPKTLEAGQIILNTCWIDGNEELKDDKSDDNMDYNIAACIQACNIIPVRTASLKKNYKAL